MSRYRIVSTSRPGMNPSLSPRSSLNPGVNPIQTRKVPTAQPKSSKPPPSSLYPRQLRLTINRHLQKNAGYPPSSLLPPGPNIQRILEHIAFLLIGPKHPRDFGASCILTEQPKLKHIICNWKIFPPEPRMLAVSKLSLSGVVTRVNSTKQIKNKCRNPHRKRYKIWRLCGL